MKRNPYIEYLINNTEENKQAVEHCNKYFDSMLEANNKFSKMYDRTSEHFDYELEHSTFTSYMEITIKEYPEYVSSIPYLDDIDFLVITEHSVTISEQYLAELELAYDLRVQQYYGLEDTSSDKASSSSDNDNINMPQQDHNSDLSITTVLIAMVISFLVIRILAYYFKDKDKITPEKDNKEIAPITEPLKNNTEIIPPTTSTVQDDVLNYMEETSSIFKYLLYIPFFTAIILTVHYLYYKFKK